MIARLSRRWTRVGKLALGLAVILGLALLAGLDSAIEAKPPVETVAFSRDKDLADLVARSRSARGDLPATTSKSANAVLAPLEFQTIRAAPRVVSADTGRIELNGAEKLSIKFQGYAELTGDYRVHSDETISIPAIGRISVAGITAAELEVALVEKAAKVTGREAYITVEVAEYRPVFVSGLVTRPGAQAWKPGMTVLHAVTLLGGVYRSMSEGGSSATGIGTDSEIHRLRKSIGDLKRSIAMAARLRAERSNAPKIEVPADLVTLVGQLEAESLIAEQMSSLTSRRTSLAAQLGSIERSRELANQELAGLQAQSKRLREMLEIRRVYKEKIDGLLAKGIVRADRGMDEQSRLGDLEDRATTISVGIARVQGMLSALERETIMLKQDRLAAVDTELIRVGKEIAAAELDIEASRNAYLKMTGTPAPTTFVEKEAAKPAVIEYHIVRQQGSVQASVKVDQFARLKPGDIILVDVQRD